MHSDCKKQPAFNIQGDSALYCGSHKKEGMVNVISKICIHSDCKKQPAFNTPGKKPLYCVTHKKEGMVDVISKTCIYEGCTTRPFFNIQGEKALYCGVHKKEGMVDVKNARCIHHGCKKHPAFNNENKRALYCTSHKKEGMVNVISKLCKSIWCSTRISEKYDGYCLFCYMNLFPDKPVSRNYKTKEYSVVEYIKTNHPDLWISDKIIDGGCSRRRPDLLLDLMDQVIIVEIDENQHIEYDCSCENKRIMELSQDLGHRPIVFIRFNPDDYNYGDTKIPSCWSTDNKGICIVKKSKKEDWDQRLNELGKTIKYWLKYRTDKTVEIIHLFYNS